MTVLFMYLVMLIYSKLGEFQLLSKELVQDWKLKNGPLTVPRPSLSYFMPQTFCTRVQC